MISTENRRGFHRIELRAEPEGVYVFVWLRPDSQAPEYDYLQDSDMMAKEFCLQDFGAPVSSWRTR